MILMSCKNTFYVVEKEGANLTPKIEVLLRRFFIFHFKGSKSTITSVCFLDTGQKSVPAPLLASVVFLCNSGRHLCWV